jgi:hypothetical protein
MPTTVSDSAEGQLAGFLDKFTPEIAASARLILAAMRARLPGAVQLVYDNYNALAIGFGPSRRASEAVFSVAVYPRWVSLFFLQGARLADPAGLLKGSGNVAKHIVLAGAEDLDKPAVIELMQRAMRAVEIPIDPAKGELVIQSVSAKQRPRRPNGEARRPTSGEM